MERQTFYFVGRKGQRPLKSLTFLESLKIMHCQYSTGKILLTNTTHAQTCPLQDALPGGQVLASSIPCLSSGTRCMISQSHCRVQA